MGMDVVMDFLYQLEEHNSIAWMHQNKAYYQQAKLGFESFLKELIEKIAVFDLSVKHLEPKELVFRLNRDTRFSRDKSPYQPAFRAHISAAGRQPVPVGYYLCIRPGTSFLGGGLFAFQLPEATRMIREHIRDNADDLQQLMAVPEFQENFTITGEKLKRIPKGFDPEHPLAEYVKHKSWNIEYPLPDSQVRNKEELLLLAAELFSYMKPFHDFLNQGLAGFEMPKQ